MDKQKDKISKIKQVLSQEAEEIEKLQKKLDDNVLLAVINLLEKCQGKIILSGCGTSGVAAEKIAHTLSCVEIPAMFLSPAKALHGGMGVVQKDDILILVSKGGHTEELDKMCNACARKKAKIVAVTENESCFLAQNSDVVLTVRVDREPDEFGMLATASTLSVIAVFDAIAIAIAEDKKYTKKEFLLILPGGEVGEKLELDVQRETT